MFSAYTTLFRTPGGMKFSIAGFIGRMPISMEGLALIFVVVAASDSYALAGLLSAIAEITKSIATPFWSRQADRYGQRKVLLLIVPARTILMAFFIICVLNSTPIWTWFLTIILAELTTINAGGMVRIRWLYVLNKTRADHHLINTAYSYESLIDEFVFIFGPMIATVCATSIHPAAGLIAALFFFCTGQKANIFANTDGGTGNDDLGVAAVVQHLGQSCRQGHQGFSSACGAGQRDKVHLGVHQQVHGKVLLPVTGGDAPHRIFKVGEILQRFEHCCLGADFCDARVQRRLTWRLKKYELVDHQAWHNRARDAVKSVAALLPAFQGFALACPEIRGQGQ